MKNVHTEHCCERHGCKYCEPDCPVENGIQKQSFPCELCPDPNNLVYKVRDKTNGLFKRKRSGSHGWNKVGDTYASRGIAKSVASSCCVRRENLEIVEFELKELGVIT